MSEYIINLPNGGAADECIRLRGYEKSLYGYELHEEIVRCRDCTHFMTWTNGYSFCSAFSIGATGEPFPGEPDGYCKWGELRGDAE